MMSFTKETHGKVLLFSLQADVTPDVAKLISEDIIKNIGANSGLEKVALDFKKQYQIDSSAFRVFSPIAVNLRKQQKSLYILNPPADLATFLRDMGLSSLMKPVDSIQEMNAEVKVATPAMGTVFDVKFINPFVQGTISTLKIQCDLDCKPLKATVKEKLSPAIVVDIAGLIGITSKTFTGSVSICFPEKTFLAAMSNMMGETCSEVTAELEEGAGELINVIFGQAKKVLNEQGHTLEKALPTVIRGKNVDVKHMTSNPAILIPFESSAGFFYLEIGTRDKA